MELACPGSAYTAYSLTEHSALAVTLDNIDVALPWSVKSDRLSGALRPRMSVVTADYSSLPTGPFSVARGSGL